MKTINPPDARFAFLCCCVRGYDKDWYPGISTSKSQPFQVSDMAIIS